MAVIVAVSVVALNLLRVRRGEDRRGEEQSDHEPLHGGVQGDRRLHVLAGSHGSWLGDGALRVL